MHLSLSGDCRRLRTTKNTHEGLGLSGTAFMGGVIRLIIAAVHRGLSVDTGSSV